MLGRGGRLCMSACCRERERGFSRSAVCNCIERFEPRPVWHQGPGACLVLDHVTRTWLNACLSNHVRIGNRLHSSPTSHVQEHPAHQASPVSRLLHGHQSPGNKGKLSQPRCRTPVRGSELQEHLPQGQHPALRAEKAARAQGRQGSGPVVAGRACANEPGV
jgi:hypothetical protein